MPVNAPRIRIAAPRRRRQSRSGLGVRSVAAAATSAVALGALLEYFLDPGAGRRRRHTARDRIMSKLRRSERRAVTRARRAESRAVGIVRRTLNARHAPKAPADDIALAHHVESELFRRARETVTKRISGVRHVENLLHLPDTPAPASRPKLVRNGRP
jgi:ribosomal protein L31E